MSNLANLGSAKCSFLFWILWEGVKMTFLFTNVHIAVSAHTHKKKSAWHKIGTKEYCQKVVSKGIQRKFFKKATEF